jgi:Domain of unknown function (DUF3597)
MGLFSNIMSKIFGGSTTAAPAPPSPAPAVTPTAASAPGNMAAPPPPTAIPPVAPPPVVDVTAILDGFAAKNPEKLDWRKSIVDLMKLVGLDSSLAARKELAAELHYPGDTGDSAKMNVWLHKEVIKKLAANGGTVPADLLD